MNRSPGSSICLAMIVRDEAHVIERCLRSVAPLISAWLIVDTGSTDDTERVTRAALRGVPGEYVHRAWRSFAENRSECLELARPRADYTLVIDADDVLDHDPNILPLRLDADAYTLAVFHGEVVHHRLHLFSARLPWKYQGAVHEFATCEQARPALPLTGVRYVVLGGGARSRDPHKYRKDAELLEEITRAEPDEPRHVFYLAQSYRDAGLPSEAHAAYLKRAAMGGWDEEVWFSLNEAARLARELAPSQEQVVAAYLRAHAARPSRAESLCELANYCRQHGRFSAAHVFAKAAAALPLPEDRLFVNRAVYDWKALDELAIAAYYVGREDEALVANDRLLKEGLLPPAERARVQQNRTFCVERLRTAPNTEKSRA